jgi:carboxyltransferase family protein
VEQEASLIPPCGGTLVELLTTVRSVRSIDSWAAMTISAFWMIASVAPCGHRVNSKSLGATAMYVWSSAEGGVMYPSGAVKIIHRRRRLSEIP